MEQNREVATRFLNAFIGANETKRILKIQRLAEENPEAALDILAKASGLEWYWQKKFWLLLKTMAPKDALELVTGGIQRAAKVLEGKCRFKTVKGLFCTAQVLGKTAWPLEILRKLKGAEIIKEALGPINDPPYLDPATFHKFVLPSSLVFTFRKNKQKFGLIIELSTVVYPVKSVRALKPNVDLLRIIAQIKQNVYSLPTRRGLVFAFIDNTLYFPDDPKSNLVVTAIKTGATPQIATLLQKNTPKKGR
jgi:hypothetical protein